MIDFAVLVHARIDENPVEIKKKKRKEKRKRKKERGEKSSNRGLVNPWDTDAWLRERRNT